MVSVKHLHTFGIDAECEKIVEVTSSDQLHNIIENVSDQPKLILGEGSNCIFVSDFAGTVIIIKLLGKTLKRTDTHHMVTVGAGENWHGLVLWCLDKQVYGLENLALIPGSVGAAPIQNIGAYGVEIERFIHSVSYFDCESGRMQSLTREQCEFEYRDSIFKHRLANKAVVTEITFALPIAWQPAITYGELRQLEQPSAQDIFDKVCEIRRAKLPDPSVVGNAGSFFKNPVIPNHHFHNLKAEFDDIPGFVVDEQNIKVPAAWLIDQAGFKGQQRDGIQCHPKQALVLTNSDRGSGEALLSFAREIRAEVFRRYAIQLENEVRLIGQQGLVSL